LRHFIGSGAGARRGQALCSFEGCLSLVSVRVGRNQLGGEVPAGIGSLSKLEELDLEDNRIKGTLHQNLTKLTRLRTLRVADNDLT
jgi:hypothetical protein